MLVRLNSLIHLYYENPMKLIGKLISIFWNNMGVLEQFVYFLFDWVNVLNVCDIFLKIFVNFDVNLH